MKILRLELQGFKSFKDKTIIHFDQPITAIVGSNGCGKSNVVDALYWVMGDMSPKHLRGSQMTDVIFSGTRNTQAMDMAEVTLVMERNPETDPALPPQFQTMNEVQITRRYYRHGESEYFINRVNCRLRDVQEFFMDTGIGAKSYSIIEQGAITRMVAQKPEERRVVLEDVAGITKFKARRAETERKLEQSNLNLQRVDDLVKDLQKQLGTLQRQAEKAQKFKEWSDELRNLEIRVAGKDWTTRRDRLSHSKGETENTSQKLTTLEAELHNSRAELQSYRESFEALEQDLAYLRSSRQENELKIKEKEGHIQGLLIKEESLVRRRERDEQTKKHLSTRKEELDLSLNILATDLLSTEAGVSSFIQKIEELRTGIDQVRNEYEILRTQVDASRRDLHVQDLAITKLSQEIQVDQKQTLQLEDRQQIIEETRVDIEREFISKTNERSGAERLLQDAFAERKDLEGQKEDIDQRIQGYEQELAVASDQMLKAQEDLTRDRVRHSHLHELDKNLEGIGAASRSLAMHMREQGHLSPLIADQVKVPQLLERAVEAAFSDLLETVVVEKSSEAEELLNYLKVSDNSEAKSTRIKFFIKDFVRSTPAPLVTSAPESFSTESFSTEATPGPDNFVNLAASSQLSATENRPTMTMDRYLREHPAVVGRLDELLTQEGVIPMWAQNYGHWWVVRDRSAFENLRPSINNEVTLVSLEGDLFYPNGFIDYAPFEESDESVGHLVQRRRELQELKLRVDSKTIEVDALHSQVDTLKKNLSSEREAYKLLTQRLVALNPGLQKHTDLIRDLEGQVARLSEKKDNLNREYEQNSEKLETLKSQLEERNERLIDQSSARKSYEDALNENLEQLKLVELRNRDKSQELESQQKLYNDLLKKLTTQKTEQASLLQEKNLSDSRIQQLDAELVDIASLLEQLSVE
ncbi:MAG: AAA family ATPase, partial [bacterium]